MDGGTMVSSRPHHCCVLREVKSASLHQPHFLSKSIVVGGWDSRYATHSSHLTTVNLLVLRSHRLWLSHSGTCVQSRAWQRVDSMDIWCMRAAPIYKVCVLKCCATCTKVNFSQGHCEILSISKLCFSLYRGGRLDRLRTLNKGLCRSCHCSTIQHWPPRYPPS